MSSGQSRIRRLRGIPLFSSGFPERKIALVENKTVSRALVSLSYKRAR
jgi:hypothetical protein